MSNVRQNMTQNMKKWFVYWLPALEEWKNPYIRTIFRFERISVATWVEHRDEDVAFNTYSIWIIRIHHVYFIKHDLLFLRRLWIFHALSRSSLFPMMKIQCDTMARQWAVLHTERLSDLSTWFFGDAYEYFRRFSVFIFSKNVWEPFLFWHWKSQNFS